MLSRSFPAQRCLHNVRQTIVRTFLSRCCGIFERVNDWLVVWCLVSPVIMFWLMFRQYRHLLAQTQHSGVRVVLMLLCCHWARKCLMGCLVFRLIWNCPGQRFCYCSVVSIIPSLLQDLMTVYIFLFQHWTSLTSFHCAKTFVENLLNALFNSLNLLKFKIVIW